MGINGDGHQWGRASIGTGIKRDSWHQLGWASIGPGLKRVSKWNCFELRAWIRPTSIGSGINRACWASKGTGIKRDWHQKVGINKSASIGRHQSAGHQSGYSLFWIPFYFSYSKNLRFIDSNLVVEYVEWVNLGHQFSLFSWFSIWHGRMHWANIKCWYANCILAYYYKQHNLQN